MAPLKRPLQGLGWALGLSSWLLFLRWHLASFVGFGDAEALYAAYALHPQPAYLDHPGLVGVVARLIGHGSSPSPEATHHVTAIAATLLPVLGLLVARAATGAWSGALLTFFAVSLLPEMSIGLFALTPDLPLAFAWLGALGLGALALRKDPASRTALAATVGAGFLCGVAILSKASGVLLLLALMAGFASKPARARLRTIGPWCGLGVALVLALPLFVWERQHDWALLTHRLVTTQTRAGFSLRNAGALVGGQLLYVTPPFLIAAVRVFRGLLRRAADPVARLLIAACVVPGIPLIGLCLWSRVAEPHWLAPAYLALAVGAAYTGLEGKVLRAVCVTTGLVAAGLGWASVATPLVPLLARTHYVPRYDLVNDLFAWRGGLPVIEEELEQIAKEGGDGVIVGPHWMICAQVHAALGAAVPVGCRTPGGDDFSAWLPEKTWSKARTILFVTDDRFPSTPATEFPGRDVVRVRAARIYRAGRMVRVIRVVRLDRTGVAGG